MACLVDVALLMFWASNLRCVKHKASVACNAADPTGLDPWSFSITSCTYKNSNKKCAF